MTGSEGGSTVLPDGDGTCLAAACKAHAGPNLRTSGRHSGSVWEAALHGIAVRCLAYLHVCPPPLVREGSLPASLCVSVIFLAWK